VGGPRTPGAARSSTCIRAAAIPGSTPGSGEPPWQTAGGVSRRDENSRLTRALEYYEIYSAHVWNGAPVCRHPVDDDGRGLPRAQSELI